MSAAEPSAALAEHRALVAALRDPACYAHAVGKIRVIETHISSVLLTGPFAYKLKKPVAPGFLDYTTLAARQHFCIEELHLNQRLAPRLYLEVVPIGGTPQAPRVGAAAGVFDYAVKMVEFPQEALLDRQLAAGALAPAHIDALAAKLAAFHAAAHAAGDPDDWGRAEHVLAPVRRNFTTLARCALSPAERDELDRVAAWSEARHAELAPLMEERRRAGRVRECHGDLHLGNIALVDGEVEIFDCIEFDPELRWIDVASELAFLAMDLHAHGRADYAARLVNGWLEASGDYGCAPLLPYYLVYRAMVRAMVARLRAEQSAAGSAAARAARAEFADRLALAAAFIRPHRPALVITHGVAGSGKTTYSQAVLEALGALRLRSDVERKRLFGLAAGARSGAAVGAGIYGAGATGATYDALAALARGTLAAGFDTVVDATFLRRAQREAFGRLARELGVPFLILDCRAGPGALRERVAQREARGLDASEATVAVLEAQLAGEEPLTPEEETQAVAVDSERDGADTVVARVRAALSARP